MRSACLHLLARQSTEGKTDFHETRLIVLRQVVGAQQQAQEHRARHRLICAFYPWLEMSLKQAQMSHNKPQRSSSGCSGHLGDVTNR